MNVLIITGILPVQEIEYKKTENDIILLTAQKIKNKYSDVEFNYLFVFPFANRILAFLSKKWESYFKLSKKDRVTVKGQVVFPFPLVMIPGKLFFRYLLIDISYLFRKRKIIKLINKLQPTILHAHEADSSAYLARKLSKHFDIPYIVTLRGVNEYYDNKINRNLENADKIVAINSQQKNVIPKSFHIKTEFIPHGLDGRFFSKRKNPTIGKTVRLLTVSRLLKLKNIDLTLATLAKFKHDFIFDIYGDGPERNRLEELINKYNLQGKVFLKGFIDNKCLPDVYSNYDLFIMVSYPEALGRVYFEAMAAGLPVIASKNTGIDGLITDRKEGVLLDVFSKDFSIDLLTTLNEFSEDKSFYKSCSNNARLYASKFLWENILPKHYRLYK